MRTFRVTLISPLGVLWEGDAVSVGATGVDGQFGVLARHAPLLAQLSPGVLKIETAHELIFFAAAAGVFEVAPTGEVILLVDHARVCPSLAEARETAREWLAQEVVVDYQREKKEDE